MKYNKIEHYIFEIKEDAVLHIFPSRFTAPTLYHCIVEDPYMLYDPTDLLMPLDDVSAIYRIDLAELKQAFTYDNTRTKEST